MRVDTFKAIALMVFMAVAISTPAVAFETIWQEHNAPEYPFVHHSTWHRHHRHVQVREIIHHEVLVKEHHDLGGMCVERRIDVVSAPRQTIDKAKDDAQTEWRAKAQFLVGGVYMDPNLAKGQKWLCSITDARDSASGRVSETTGVLLGHSGELYRCYFSARPCRSDMQSGDDDE